MALELNKKAIKITRKEDKRKNENPKNDHFDQTVTPTVRLEIDQYIFIYKKAILKQKMLALAPRPSVIFDGLESTSEPSWKVPIDQIFLFVINL